MEIDIKLSYAFNKYHIESNLALMDMSRLDMLKTILDLVIGRSRYSEVKEEDGLHLIKILKFGTNTTFSIILVEGDLEDNVKNLTNLFKSITDYLDIDKTVNIYVDEE